MDKGREGYVASCPSRRYGDEYGCNAPGVDGVVWLDRIGVGRKDPEDEQGQRIYAQEGNGSGDQGDREEHKYSAEEFTNVGATDHDLLQGAQRIRGSAGIEERFSPNRKSRALCVWLSQVR